MREIRFRAWNGKNMEAVDGYDLVVADGKLKSLELSTGDAGTFAVLDDAGYPLMQYTGLKDKNGVEIYEGDIVRRGGNGILGSAEAVTHMHRVYWLDSISGFALESIDGGLTAHDPHAARLYFISEIAEGEVIGNIYENPELLEKGSE